MMERAGELAAKAAAQPEFKAETTWFHVFRGMIDCGDFARIDGSAIKCYLVIKSHTNFSSGRSFPGHDLIAEKSGLSQSQVKRAIQQLEKFGYLGKKKAGRNNNYTLREKVQVIDEHGQPAAFATWDYLPNSVSVAMADLKNVLMTGDLGGAKIVHIERLNVQINTGSGVGIEFNGADFEKLPAAMREALLKIKNCKE